MSWREIKKQLIINTRLATKYAIENDNSHLVATPDHGDV